MEKNEPCSEAPVKIGLESAEKLNLLFRFDRRSGKIVVIILSEYHHKLCYALLSKGLMIAIVRGLASTSAIENSWRPVRTDVPKAPGLGLMLEQVMFLTRYFIADFIQDLLHSYCGMLWIYTVKHLHLCLAITCQPRETFTIMNICYYLRFITIPTARDLQRHMTKLTAMNIG